MALLKGMTMPKLLRNMDPKKRQYVVLAALIGLFFASALFVSSMIGGSEPTPAGAAATEGAKAPLRGLSTVPGSTITDKDAWIGTAARDVEVMKQRQAEDRQRQDHFNKQLQAQLEHLQNRAISGGGLGERNDAERNPPSPTPTPAPSPSAPGRSSGSGPALGSPPNPSNGQIAGGPNANTYPPGQPGSVGQASAPPSAPLLGLTRVSLSAAQGVPTQAASAGAPGSTPASTQAPDATKSPPRIGNTLPISFARAQLLTGVDAPTGSIAPKNPLPVMLRVADLAVLPNKYRADIKECFIVGAAHGDLPSERAYIRGERLSCVTKREEIVEVAIKATVYGEDGKAGMRGRLIEKQGALLANALLAGIASGIGQGFAQHNQVLSVSPLGATATTPSNKILENALASGIGKSMDRLAQFYIDSAQRMFPIIEIDSGRTVDVGFLEAVNFATALPAGSSVAASSTRTLDRSPMMRAINNTEDDDEE